MWKTLDGKETILYSSLNSEGDICDRCVCYPGKGVAPFSSMPRRCYGDCGQGDYQVNRVDEYEGMELVCQPWPEDFFTAWEAVGANGRLIRGDDLRRRASNVYRSENIDGTCNINGPLRNGLIARRIRGEDVA